MLCYMRLYYVRLPLYYYSKVKVIIHMFSVIQVTDRDKMKSFEI